MIGTGNADGSVIEARGYSVGGDFSGTGACADFDADGDVDADDFAVLEACFSGPDVPVTAGCEDKDFDRDGDVDGMDYARFQLCMSGAGVAPPPGCEGTPPSGSFALHGRPVDVLSDGLVLMPIRARTYDPRHGRWLQRDPLGYADGPNLYEAFRGNATVFTDPSGTQMPMPCGQFPDDYFRTCASICRPLSDADREDAKAIAKTGAVAALNVLPYAFGVVPGLVVNTVTLSLVGETAYHERQAQYMQLTGQRLAADEAVAIVFFDVTGISAGYLVWEGEDMLTTAEVSPETRADVAGHMMVAIVVGGATARSLPAVSSMRPALNQAGFHGLTHVLPRSKGSIVLLFEEGLNIGIQNYAGQTPAAAAAMAEIVQRRGLMPEYAWQPEQLSRDGSAVAANCGDRAFWNNGWRTADGKFAKPLGPGLPGAAAEVDVWGAVAGA